MDAGHPDDAATPDDEPAGQPSGTTTIGGFSGSDRAWVLVIFGGAGAIVGALVPVLAGWASSLPWMPFQGPLELLGSFDQSWLVWGRPLLGLVVGLLIGLVVVSRTPVLRVGPGEIEVVRGGDVERVIDRDDVAATYRRGSHLVIETAQGRSLFDAEVEGDKDRHRAVLVEAGYPWEGARG
ncbi:YqeB family protein [Georgenia sp. Z1344]|uniref:YqeB family protein n=1 Tax=Georgenia sp. Z1344 TaxID=3416706 RepID=UPI003CF6AF13